ncbi:MAG: PAS domain S-box protein [Verrucomicrobiota bacterium]
MKLSLERKITLGFSGALLLLAFVFMSAAWCVGQFKQTTLAINHSRDVLSRLQEVHIHVLDMQSAVRGFTITGNEAMVTRFAAGSTELDATIDTLRELIGDNPRQQQRLPQLAQHLQRAREIMQTRIAERRNRGAAVLADPPPSFEGQRSVEAVRELIRTMVANEHTLLDDRLARSRAIGGFSMMLIASASVVAIGLGTIAVRRVTREIRYRRLTEARLKVCLAHIEDLYNHAPCGYHSLDPAGLFGEINDTMLGWLGYTREEMVGRMTFSDILAPESAAAFPARYARFKETGSTTNSEYTWLRKDGSRLIVLLNKTAVYDSNGVYVASRSTVFDISQLKRAEEERDRFFTLSRDLLCIATVEGRFKRVNPAWETALGYTPEQLHGQPFAELIHPDDRERTGEEVERLARGEESIDFENRYRHADGTYRWLRWNARSTPDEKLIYASARDVTEARASDDRIHRLNTDLGQRARQLEAANQELESFSYSVSHDLRAPLRHVDGFASLLSKRIGPEADKEAQRYVTTISRAAKQMGTLIDDLLAFSRVGRTPLRLEPIDHNALVADVLENGHYRSGERQIVWEIGALPPVRADRALLRQVWVNLIENAVKYSGKSPAPRIAIGGGPNPEDASEAIFFVRDNGVGFDMAYADKLFGVFQRLHGPTEFEGTGIGLANVRRIVARHNGRTWAEGRVDEGAVFYFSIPVTLPPPHA